MNELVKWRELSITKDGVWFPYDGDVVLYVWPWKRTTYKYVSLLCEGTFNSLEEINEFWAAYSRANN